MIVLTIALQKGGTAKTTTAQALGEGLAREGYNVLFIDLDTQGNLSTILGAKPSTKSSYEVLRGQIPITEAIQRTEGGDIIATSPKLSLLEGELTGPGRCYRLQEALGELSGYDFVVIDTPPASGVIVDNSLTASNGVIVPVQPDIFSYQGLKILESTIHQAQRYNNPGLEILGILITRWNARAVLNQQILETFEEEARKIGTVVYGTKIRECITIKEAQASRTSIYDYPRTNASKDYKAFVKEVLAQLNPPGKAKAKAKRKRALTEDEPRKNRDLTKDEPRERMHIKRDEIGKEDRHKDRAEHRRNDQQRGPGP